MLGFVADTKNERKCNVVHGIMGHLDPVQPPVKRKPFVNILNNKFVQKLELILPDELYELFKGFLVTERARPTYSRVIMPLAALLEGEFFNEYIKRGNIMMLSENHPRADRVYSLREGILTLFLDKESYERAGIVGRPDGVKGKRGTKPRWIVEINLRLPSMLHGKKGFDRLVYAFKNVLKDPVTWLFHDLGDTNPKSNPVDLHFPTKVIVEPKIAEDLRVCIPPLTPPADIQHTYNEDFDDFAVETHEWLSLISLNSPRINPKDGMDSFLSRYIPPGGSSTESKLVKITWQGFLRPSWAHGLFVEALLATPRESWFSCSVVGFGETWSGDGKDSTILKPPHTSNEYVLWEVTS